MEIIRRIVKIMACAAILAVPQAARGQVEWESTTIDYGTFREASGPEKREARFVNKGDRPTFINSVRPGCGCTAATYPEGMIAPGDTAAISLIYNPIGRPGRFDKTVKVYMGEERALTVLKIRGTVIGAPSTLESTYPYVAGPLRLTAETVPAGDVTKGQTRHMYLNVYNQSGDTIRPSWKGDGNVVSVEMTPKELAPGDVGTIGFYLRTPAEPRLGRVEYPIEITADSADPHSEARTVTVTAKILPNPNEIVNDGAAGNIRITPEVVDLGDLEKGRKVAFKFTITNEGTEPLKIYSIYPLTKGLTLKSVGKELKAGKRIEVKGTADPGLLPEGPFRVEVEVMSNDRQCGISKVRVVGINGDE